MSSYGVEDEFAKKEQLCLLRVWNQGWKNHGRFQALIPGAQTQEKVELSILEAAPSDVEVSWMLGFWKVQAPGPSSQAAQLLSPLCVALLTGIHPGFSLPAGTSLSWGVSALSASLGGTLALSLVSNEQESAL